MKNFECICSNCESKTQIRFEEQYPSLEEVFRHFCKKCNKETDFRRVLTRKAAAEERRIAEENELRSRIIKECNKYGFSYRFVYQSVVITTNLSDWSFDYHKKYMTLYHESTIKINRETGQYAKTHVQFKDRKMTPVEVISYIAEHERWRESNSGKSGISG